MPASTVFHFGLQFESDSDGGFTGRISEPATFGNGSSSELYANVSGRVSGDRISFTKRYDGTAGVTHVVYYSGSLDSAGDSMTGEWSLNGGSGSFSASLTGGHPLREVAVQNCEGRARLVNEWTLSRSAVLMDTQRLQNFKTTMESQVQRLHFSGHTYKVAQETYDYVNEMVLDHVPEVKIPVRNSSQAIELSEEESGLIVNSARLIANGAGLAWQHYEDHRMDQSLSGMTEALKAIKAQAERLSYDVATLAAVKNRLRNIGPCDSTDLVRPPR